MLTAVNIYHRFELFRSVLQLVMYYESFFLEEKISMYVIRLMPKEKDERPEREREKGRDCVLRGGVDV